MSNDILDQVRRFQPDELTERWPAPARTALAERIRQDDPAPLRPRRLPPRRVLLGSGLVAAGVLAAVAVPAILPDGAPGAANPAAAAALHRLARTAAGAPVEVAGPGQFIHTITRQTQHGLPAGPAVDTALTTEAWRASDGRLWRRDLDDLSRRSTTQFFPADGTPSYLASLPTDPADLGRYLRDHASGSDSIDEAVFVAVGDLLRDGGAPASLRSAAVAVLARTDQVRLGLATRDDLGRAVQEFDFVDDASRPGQLQALYFDPGTAQVLDERTTGPGFTSTSSVLRSDIVDSVPAEVLSRAVRSN